MKILSIIPLLLLLPLLGGCLSVSYNYSRVNVHEPVEDGSFQNLFQQYLDQSTGVELQHCMDSLGAPNLVWESPKGLALAYVWQDQSSWGFNISYSFERFISARFDFSNLDQNLNGLVLLFDDGLQLLELRRGYISQIINEVGRTRPAAMAE